jgi:hypothetical protein
MFEILIDFLPTCFFAFFTLADKEHPGFFSFPHII